MTQVDKVKERQRLITLITQWNEEHVEIFELSQPNEVKHRLFKFVLTFILHNLSNLCIAYFDFCLNHPHVTCISQVKTQVSQTRQQILQNGRPFFVLKTSGPWMTLRPSASFLASCYSSQNAMFISGFL